MKLCLIVNPNAGRKRGLEAARLVTASLARAGIDSTELVSLEPGGTRKIAAEIDPGEWDGVLAVGGDGTLFEVVNGLLEERDAIPLPVGIVPVGTGNSFVRDLGVETVEQALEPVLAGRTRRIDLGHFTCGVHSYFFANLLGAGFVSNVASRARRFKAFGALSYVAGVLGEVVRLRSTEVRIDLDGTVIERDAIFVEICNSRFTGGSMMMAPGASIDDGLLDVVVASAMTRRNVLALLPTIFAGKHVESPYVEVFRGASISVTSAAPMALTPDGEIFGFTPIEVDVRPAALEVFG